MSDSFRPWTPDFADRIGEEFNSEKQPENKKSQKEPRRFGNESGKTRVGSDPKGLCRRPPVRKK